MTADEKLSSKSLAKVDELARRMSPEMRTQLEKHLRDLRKRTGNKGGRPSADPILDAAITAVLEESTPQKSNHGLLLYVLHNAAAKLRAKRYVPGTVAELKKNLSAEEKADILEGQRLTQYLNDNGYSAYDCGLDDREDRVLVRKVSGRLRKNRKLTQRVARNPKYKLLKKAYAPRGA